MPDAHFQKLVMLDEDIYRFLLKHALAFEDNPSTILRRLLRVGELPTRVQRKAPVGSAKPGTARDQGLAGALEAAGDHELAAAIARAPWFPFQVQRYLYLLDAVRRCRTDFRPVLRVRGRSRCYFATSRQFIERSGTATYPQPIGASGYWAATNLPARDKERILRNVLMTFEFDDRAMRAAREFLLRGRIPAMPG